MNKKTIDIKKISVRLATLQDIKIVYDLATDDLVRKSSFNSQQIKYKDHEVWYKNKIKNDNFILFIIEYANKFAGQVKFEIDHETALIGVSICPEYRGYGLGSIFLTLGISKLIEINPKIKIINALIKNENIASIKIFEKVGFKYSNDDLINNIPSKKYVYKI